MSFLVNGGVARTIRFMETIALGHIARHPEDPSNGGANSPFNDHKHNPLYTPTIANRTTRRHPSRPVSPTTHPRSKRRASSPSFSNTGSFDSSDDDINAPVTPPPIVKSLSRYVQRAKARPRPYERRDPSTQHRRYAATQLSPIDSTPVPDVQKGKALLESRLQHLSSGAIAQAVITKQADIEWRRVRALATAWIQAIEEHKRFLQMVLEDDELSKGSVDELNERLHSCMAAYSPDVTSLAVGHKQLDLMEDIAYEHPDDYAAERRLPGFRDLDDCEDHSSSCESLDGLSAVSAKSDDV
ncbi:hypothetical protein DEU56DRAFT_905906 [Suillus clintonianus]|uniref:uncharacterized protein n=1 Tax=Suillus clintonianus TaxID=1904413 RepID=UPI001B85D60A|nr:uncharacterized protein DEU56DRAFT_905906 [Suillus clintonianus]KAG2157243.1 hypothetical protein DEU56DRAFT_905906 [Suillus clintonianus]